jgi:hypothetical protein
MGEFRVAFTIAAAHRSSTQICAAGGVKCTYVDGSFAEADGIFMAIDSDDDAVVA